MQKEQEEQSSRACRSTCANCTASNIQLQVCSRCKSVRYCSKECQASHWKEGGHKKVCNAIVAQKTASTAASNHDDCAICLDTLSLFPTSELSCGHCFHIKCINKILQLNDPLQICPLCRAIILDLNQDADNMDASRFYKRYAQIRDKKEEHLKEKAKMFTCLNKIVEKNSNAFHAHYLIAVMLKVRGENAESERVLRIVINICSSFEPAYLLLADLLVERKNFTEAAMNYRSSIALNPTDAITHRKLGKILHFNLRKLREAEACYRAALALEPNCLATFAQLFDCEGNLPKAEKAYRRVLQVEPDDYDAHYYLANVLLKRVKLVEAENVCRAAIALRPDEGANAYATLGEILITKDDISKMQNEGNKDMIAEAETAFRKAIILETNNFEGNFGLGRILAKRHAWAKAEARFRIARLHTENLGRDVVADVEFYLGITLNEQRNFIGAEAQFRLALSIYSDAAGAAFGRFLGWSLSGPAPFGPLNSRAPFFDPFFKS